jgi:hypothetical protein
MNVFELARLRLLDLQTRYLEMLPRSTKNSMEFRAQIMELESMSRERLVECLLAGRP